MLTLFTLHDNANAVLTPYSTHFLLSTGSVPGIEASIRATCQYSRNIIRITMKKEVRFVQKQNINSIPMS